MNCSTCQTPIQPGAAFCDNCGTPVSASPPTPAAAAPPMPGGGIICPQCQTAAMPGEAFCGNCGASLVQAAAVPAYQPPAAPAPVYQPSAPPQSAISCSQCGTSLTAGSAFCDNCGAAVGASAAPPPPQAWQQPQPPAQPWQPAAQPAQPQQWQPAAVITPRLVIQETNTPVNLPAGKTELLIGREDPVSGHFPEVNLGPFKGEELGVSRSHAKLTIQGNQCFLEDLQSVNFTHVNKQRLQPGTRQPLNSGDELRFGKLVVLFYTQ